MGIWCGIGMTLFCLVYLNILFSGVLIVLSVSVTCRSMTRPTAPREHKHVQILVVTQLWWHPLIASLICNGV
jgi:hypothetical protein